MRLFIYVCLFWGAVSTVYAKSYTPSPADKQKEAMTLNALYSKHIDHVYQASVLTGLDMTEIAAFMKVESTFNERAYNPRYGASGLFQQIPSTWTMQKRLYAKKMGIKHNADVFTPKANIYIGTAALAAERKRLAKDTHRTPEAIQSGELYLAHLYGYNKAIKILTAPKKAKITHYVRVSRSSGLSYHTKKRIMTVEEFIHGVNVKMDNEKAVFKRKSDHYQLTLFIAHLKLAHRHFATLLT